MDKKVVLVVDDDEDFLQLVTLVLEDSLDVTVVPVNDGNQALERIKQTKPALVLLDRIMPGVDGLEILRQLKSDPATRAIPVVVCTAWAKPEGDIVGAGSDDLLQKPFEMDTLLTTVSKYL